MTFWLMCAAAASLLVLAVVAGRRAFIRWYERRSRQVTITGSVTPHQKLLRAPFSGRECVAWRARLERWGASRRVFEGSQSASFLVVEREQRFLVPPTREPLELPWDQVMVVQDSGASPLLERLGLPGSTGSHSWFEAVLLPDDSIEVRAEPASEAEADYRTSARPIRRLASPVTARVLDRSGANILESSVEPVAAIHLVELG